MGNYDTIFLGNLPYGCKFAPAIPCVRRLNTDISLYENLNLSLYLSKLYNHVSDREKEWNRYKAFFQQGDANREFTTELIAPCDADITRLSPQSRKNMEECTAYNKRMSATYVKQIYVKHGNNILTFFAQDMLFWKYFGYMESLFNGIHILSENRIIQTERRPMSIVYVPGH